MLANILHLVIYTLMSILLLVVVLRFLLQLARADFYNPLSQGIVKVTKPMLMPLRRIIPGVFGIDVAAIVLMILLQLLTILMLGSVHGQMVLFAYPFHSLAWAVLACITLVSNVYFWSIIIMIIGSWIAPGSRHPLLALANQLVEPLMAPIRRVIPPLGGVIDVSPILVIVVLKIVDMLVYRGAELALLNPRLVIGIW